MSSSDNEPRDSNKASPLFHGVSGPDYVAAMKVALATEPALQAKCLHCRLDASVPPQQQTKVYTRPKLDKHLRSHFHDRREQIKRLFRLDKNDVGTFKCPCCSADHPKYWREEECLAHMEAEHKVAME
ncbi:hypothetical protein Q7P36_003142 [Cladosporium allicinum]